MRRAFAVALTAAAFLTQSHVVSAAVSLGPNFDPKGEVHMASLMQSDPVTTTASFNTGFAAIPGLTMPITIPRGKIADVKILFTGEMNSADAGFVSAVVDGSPAPPGVVQAFWGVHGGATSQSASFSAFLTEGDHFIQMQWGGLGGQQFMSLRSMIVIVNLRRTVGQQVRPNS